ncbi:hypothetical protein R3O55_010515 [Bacteroides hominis]|uniref:hypothetical protein n=1 Tax=Bacteroides hominis TaxID=2763023 RepID=UPI00294A1985|nr:hypothetical protein [Bacteroides hominis (ex Liu et al. 2022)]MDV6135848.1 hypothetical protein [Bacteroides hominis (ex Liu et al. 2022)]MDV6153048.1 hypothetical protein [Bacteroides hominis (ex Liu et al. 2022)]
MEIFTYQQKIAMMRILLDIIHADGRIDAREMFYFGQLKEEFQLSEESHNDVEEKNSLLALVQIKSFDNEQKKFFSELMSNMIVIDEDIDPNEVAIYNIVKDFASIEHGFNKSAKK